MRTAAIALAVLVVMYLGKVLFIPLFFAILISFILYPACKWMESKKIPRSAAIAIGLIALLIPVAGIGYILVMQVLEITQNWSLIWTKIGQVPFLKSLIAQQTMKTDESSGWLNEYVSKNASEVFAGIVGSITTLVQVVIIPFYVALILFQRERLLAFVQHLFPLEEAARVRSIIHETVITYYNFIKGMLIVYLTVGLLNSIGLLVLGVPHAFIYGFSASIMTFIPYVGIMIASIMPMVTVWAMHDSIYYPIGVAAIFAFVQFLEANLIFPLAVSYRVRINLLFTLMAIFLGGIVWGAAGMILFVPFVAILKLIADRTEQYKALGQLLGGEDDQKK